MLGRGRALSTTMCSYGSVLLPVGNPWVWFEIYAIIVKYKDVYDPKNTLLAGTHVCTSDSIEITCVATKIL